MRDHSERMQVDVHRAIEPRHDRVGSHTEVRLDHGGFAGGVLDLNANRLLAAGPDHAAGRERQVHGGSVTQCHAALPRAVTHVPAIVRIAARAGRRGPIAVERERRDQRALESGLLHDVPEHAIRPGRQRRQARRERRRRGRVARRRMEMRERAGVGPDEKKVQQLAVVRQQLSDSAGRQEDRVGSLKPEQIIVDRDAQRRRLVHASLIIAVDGAPPLRAAKHRQREHGDRHGRDATRALSSTGVERRARVDETLAGRLVHDVDERRAEDDGEHGEQRAKPRTEWQAADCH